MSAFAKILVGIDLSQTEPLGSAHFRRPVQAAIDAAMWLAEINRASLTFFSSIEFEEYVPHLSLMAEEPAQISSPLITAAHAVLDQLVDAAKARAIYASQAVEEGIGWVRIIDYVRRNGIDLVVVGTRKQVGIARFMLGSTAHKLLRKCPCPVLVTNAESKAKLATIAVASDLTPLSEKVLKMAVGLAAISTAKVEVVHAVDFPLDHLWVTSSEDFATRRYHDRVREDALQRLRQQVTGLGPPTNPPEMHVVDGVSGAGPALLEFVAQHQVDLLVLGTVGRSGMVGAVVGNTSERLLQELPCSMLAVKPDDFGS